MSSRVALCWKCGHETRRHQPSLGYRTGSSHETVGCSECNCLITMTQKLRFWQVIA